MLWLCYHYASYTANGQSVYIKDPDVIATEDIEVNLKDSKEEDDFLKDRGHCITRCWDRIFFGTFWTETKETFSILWGLVGTRMYKKIAIDTGLWRHNIWNELSENSEQNWNIILWISKWYILWGFTLKGYTIKIVSIKIHQSFGYSIISCPFIF